MKQRTVLIVTYYWPPAGGPGVQRPFYFSKYLKELGWNIVVYTVKNNSQLGLDNSNSELDVSVYYGVAPMQNDQAKGKSFVESGGLINYLKRWVRGNILIPDSKVFWYLKCNRDLKSIFSAYSVDVCLISGPPQTSHLIGYKIGLRYNIPTIHDFRDPWSKAYFLKDFPRTKLAAYIDRRLEKKVILKASGLITVSDRLRDLFPCRQSDFVVIPNGFDSEIAEEKKVRGKQVLYTGTVAESQIAYNFFDQLSKYGLYLQFYGEVHNNLKSYIDKTELNERVFFHSSVEHKYLDKLRKDSDFFLLLIPNVKDNEGILTGKLFEYLAANRPIFAIGPTNSDCSEILKSSGMGKIYEYNCDFSYAINDFLCTDFKINVDYVRKFSRFEQTKKLSTYLETFF